MFRRQKEVDAEIKTPKRVEYDPTSDEFTPTEQEKIVKQVCVDFDVNTERMKKYFEDRRLDIQHYEGEKPSILEGVKKKAWQSDRNLMICQSICDTYHSVLYAMCWNIDKMRVIDSEATDSNDATKWDKMMRYIVSRNEANCSSEVDDFIHNRVVQGFSVLKVGWEVTKDWCDRRIPNNKKGYTIKAEEIVRERGTVKNIANIEDIRIPNYGNTMQEQKNIIEILHLYISDIKNYSDDGIFVKVDSETIKKLSAGNLESLSIDEKRKSLDLIDADDPETLSKPIDILEWYGYWTKNGKTERYRFHVDYNSKTFLSGKPLRKITRTGKYPYSGGALIRKPGLLLGKSLPKLMRDLVNSINNVYNQKSDFQYVGNCPFGFYVPNENYTKQEFELTPGVMFPVDSVPQDKVYFPNIQRSEVWGYQDIQLLFELLERSTGAGSYFQTSKTKEQTATFHTLMDEKSQNRFSIIVSRILADISESLTMLMNNYQDWCPPELGDRILGEDGKKLFKNLSVETLRGNPDVRIDADVTAGSKAFKRDLMLWASTFLQGTLWFDPRVNPYGNHKLISDTSKAMGLDNIESYMPPQPKPMWAESSDVNALWTKIAQGEEPELTADMNAPVLFQGLSQKMAEKYDELDPEYKPIAQRVMFAAQVLMITQIKQKQEEEMANQLAMKMIANREGGVNDEYEPAGGSVGQSGGLVNNQGAPGMESVQAGVNVQGQSVAGQGEQRVATA